MALERKGNVQQLTLAKSGVRSSETSYFHWCTPVHRGAFCQLPFQWIYYCHSSKSTGKPTGKTHLCALCVQMDFTQTFQTKTKCNKINHVCSYFYKSLVVLKYHRCLWANIFDTDINRCINIYIKVVYLAFLGTFMLLQMSVSKILTSYINDFKHDLYFCTWNWPTMSA